MDPSFCNNENWNNQLTELTRKIFKFPNPESHDILYSELIEMYNNQSRPEFLGFDFSYNAIPEFHFIKDHCKNPKFVGIYVPSYFNHSNNGEDKKIIMVVGIDHKRNGDEFREKLSIGTPFGFNTGKTKPYWDFVKGLLDDNFTVYLTDTYKLYFKNVEKESSKIPKFTNPKIDIHQEIFANEIKIVNPDLIVTLGTIPRVWFSNLKKGKFSLKELLDISFNKTDSNHSFLYCNFEDKKIPILPLMHLSKRAITKTRMSEQYGVENEKQLIDEYVRLINRRVSC